jgi:hypothetical protein
LEYFAEESRGSVDEHNTLQLYARLRSAMVIHLNDLVVDVCENDKLQDHAEEKLLLAGAALVRKVPQQLRAFRDMSSHILQPPHQTPHTHSECKLSRPCGVSASFHLASPVE